MMRKDYQINDEKQMVSNKMEEEHWSKQTEQACSRSHICMKELSDNETEVEVSSTWDKRFVNKYSAAS